jgi:hypothetical protein
LRLLDARRLGQQGIQPVFQHADLSPALALFQAPAD